MSGIEKMQLLTIALDRIVKHGEFYLIPELSTEEMVMAIFSLKQAASKIPNWQEIVDKESNWWCDFSEKKVKTDDFED